MHDLNGMPPSIWRSTEHVKTEKDLANPQPKHGNDFLNLLNFSHFLLASFVSIISTMKATSETTIKCVSKYVSETHTYRMLWVNIRKKSKNTGKKVLFAKDCYCTIPGWSLQGQCCVNLIVIGKILWTCQTVPTSTNLGVLKVDQGETSTLR